MTVLKTPKFITVQQAESYAAHAGFNQSIVPGTNYTQQQVIVAIAISESSLNINSYNPLDPYTGSYGVLQINGVHFLNTGFSVEQAYDPQESFNYAYKLSNNGKNFKDWSTFNDNTYKKHIPIIATTSIMLPSNGWWNFNRYDHLGEPDKYGGFPKPDTNILTPDNYPVANILNGVVSGINSPNGSIPDYGAVVTIKLDKALNSLATHIAFLHLADVTVRLGQRVQVGDIIGHAGGNAAAGSQKAALGFALYHGNYYGYDGWEYMTYDNVTNKLNPVPLLDSIASGDQLSDFNLNSSFSLGNTSSVIKEFVKNTKEMINLTPNSDVVEVLVYIDNLLSIRNPFEVTAKDNNPFSWMGDLLYITFVTDLTALLIRAGIFALGGYMLFKVVDASLSITNIIGPKNDNNGPV